jgi:hypothetical protein
VIDKTRPFRFDSAPIVDSISLHQCVPLMSRHSPIFFASWTKPRTSLYEEMLVARLAYTMSKQVSR